MLTDEDDAQHPYVAIINETLAKKYFPGEDPVGKQMVDDGLTPGSMRTIVGVVADVREGALDDPAWPAEYLPMYHAPETNFSVVARTRGSAAALLPEMVTVVPAAKSRKEVKAPTPTTICLLSGDHVGSRK
jgi:macrolide transport system ATP-binding/permease protein